MSTIATLRSIVTDITRDFNYRIRSQATVDRAINTSYTTIQQDLPNLTNSTTTDILSVVAGTQEYTLTATTMNIMNVNLNDIPLTNILIETAQQHPTATWTPTSYYVTNWSIGLFPTPIASWTLDILYNEVYPTVTDLVDLETPVFLDTAIWYNTASILFTQIGKFDFAQVQMQMYTQAIDKARLQLLKDMNIHYWQQYSTSRIVL